jgi:hypothetical protein
MTTEVTTEPFEVVDSDGSVRVDRITSAENVAESSDSSLQRDNTVVIGDNPIAAGIYRIARLFGMSRKGAQTTAVVTMCVVVIGSTVYTIVKSDK